MKTGPDTHGADPRPRLTRRRQALLVLFFITFMLVIGYASYVHRIHGAYYEKPLPKADAIVVLTGGHNRLPPAAHLLSDGLGERLLVSGVNIGTSKTSLKAALEISDQLFECCVDIDRRALDTIGNAREIAAWAQKHKYQTLIVVTQDYHMPRSLSELRRQAPHLTYFAKAVRNPPQPGEGLAVKLDRTRVLIGEYLKLIASKIRHPLPKS